MSLTKTDILDRASALAAPLDAYLVEAIWRASTQGHAVPVSAGNDPVRRWHEIAGSNAIGSWLGQVEAGFSGGALYQELSIQYYNDVNPVNQFRRDAIAAGLGDAIAQEAAGFSGGERLMEFRISWNASHGLGYSSTPLQDYLSDFLYTALMIKSFDNYLRDIRTEYGPKSESENDWIRGVAWELKNYRDHLDTIGVWPKEKSDFWTEWSGPITAVAIFAAIATAGALAPVAGVASTAGTTAGATVGATAGSEALAVTGIASYTGGIIAIPYTEMALVGTGELASIGTGATIASTLPSVTSLTEAPYTPLFGGGVEDTSSLTYSQMALESQASWTPATEPGLFDSLVSSGKSVFNTVKTVSSSVSSGEKAVQSLFTGVKRPEVKKAVVSSSDSGPSILLILGGGVLLLLLAIGGK